MPFHNYIKKPRVAVDQPWSVPALCRRYQWPSGLAGGGVIAIIELGGGWRPADVLKFCHDNGVPAPEIVDVSVDGKTHNMPGVDEGADGEVALDIQVAAASYSVATGKSAQIRVYWGSDITKCIQRAHQDRCSVCSISWGAPEKEWGGEALAALGTVTHYAAENGMITFAAAGDSDSGDGAPGPANVDAPASARFVIGCGGTTLPQSGPETVWNNGPNDGTGGGYSTFFPTAAWMNGAPHGIGKLVPDLAGCADPDTGLKIVIAGRTEIIGGTSGVSPLYAGLFAAFGPTLPPVGPIIWSHHVAFTDITSGNNGAYRARIGPDPCTGLGSAIGSALAKLFVK